MKDVCDIKRRRRLIVFPPLILGMVALVIHQGVNLFSLIISDYPELIVLFGVCIIIIVVITFCICCGESIVNFICNVIYKILRSIYSIVEKVIDFFF